MFDFPIRGWPSPWFHTPNEAAQFADEYVRAGRIKRCIRLTVRLVTEQGGTRFYAPVCEQDSFRTEPATARFVGDSNPGRMFYGCPSNCWYYRSARREKLKKRAIAVIASVGQFLQALNAQPPVVKVLILSLAIVIVLASWRPDLVKIATEILKAIRGAN